MSEIIRYHIGLMDDITYVNDAWVEFARQNHGQMFTPEHVLGQTLWNFITDESTNQLYRALVARVRQGNVTQFPFRCDSPECRRLLEMTITLIEDGVIEFQTRPISIQPREPQPLLSPLTSRNSEFLNVCGWCKKVRMNGHWAEVEDAVAQLHLFESDSLPELTHGICKTCYAIMSATIEGR